MAHLQVHISKELLKQVKKSAIDKDVTVKDFVQDALVKQIEDAEENTRKEEATKK